MKQAVNSLFTAILRSRTGVARVEIQAGEQADGRPMTELSSAELKLVAGGDSVPGPHGSWNAPGANLPGSSS